MTATPEAASPAEPHRRRSWVLVAAATVVVVGGGSAVVALGGDDTAHPSAPTAIRTGSAVATWLRNNVAPSATVATIDPVLQRGLAAAGLDVTDTGSADTLPTGAYLVGVPSAAGTSAPIEITGGDALVPVARFTDGASSVQVGQLVGRTPEQVTAAAAAERTTAAAAASGLLQNAGVSPSEQPPAPSSWPAPSTLVARNLLPAEIGTARNMRRKVREALLARKIERRWSKRDVLETYVSFVFLGEGAYGMTAAARAYFDRDVGDLTLPEAALLAGLIQAPGRLDPFHHPDAARARRDEILARMARAGLIDEPTRAAAAAQPIVLHRPHPSYGTRVPWYTEEVRGLVASALPDRARARRAHDRDRRAPRARHRAPGAGAPRTRSAWKQAGVTPEIAALVWDHHTGYVEALVGGRAWGAKDRFNRFMQSCRQPGSAWKPMVYGSALDTGAITPGTPLRDAPIAEYDEVANTHWKPRSGNKFRGVVLAEDAFASSLNAPAIDVYDRVGARPVIAFARRLGITTAISELRPMALGASCVKPIELARAYAVIARRRLGDRAAGSSCACAAATTRCSTSRCPRIRGSIRRAASIASRRRPAPTPTSASARAAGASSTSRSRSNYRT